VWGASNGRAPLFPENKLGYTVSGASWTAGRPERMIGTPMNSTARRTLLSNDGTGRRFPGAVTFAGEARLAGQTAPRNRLDLVRHGPAHRSRSKKNRITGVPVLSRDNDPPPPARGASRVKSGHFGT